MVFFFATAALPAPDFVERVGQLEKLLGGLGRVGDAAHAAVLGPALGRGALFAVQFHPEKSQRHGLRMLANFAEL